MNTKTFQHTAWATALALTALMQQPAHAVPMLEFDVAAKTVQQGDTFDLLLRGSGFDTGAGGKLIDNLIGGQKLDLSFGLGVLEITKISIDPRWSFAPGNKPGAIDNALGTLTGLAFSSFPATVDDAFNVATVTFHALKAGTATTVVTAAELVGKMDGVASARIDAGFVPTVITVSAVPEPETWALMLAGLGWVAFRLRRA